MTIESTSLFRSVVLYQIPPSKEGIREIEDAFAGQAGWSACRWCSLTSTDDAKGRTATPLFSQNGSPFPPSEFDAQLLGILRRSKLAIVVTSEDDGNWSMLCAVTDELSRISDEQRPHRTSEELSTASPLPIIVYRHERDSSPVDSVLRSRASVIVTGIDQLRSAISEYAPSTSFAPNSAAGNDFTSSGSSWQEEAEERDLFDRLEHWNEEFGSEEPPRTATSYWSANQYHFRAAPQDRPAARSHPSGRKRTTNRHSPPPTKSRGSARRDKPRQFDTTVGSASPTSDTYASKKPVVVSRGDTSSSAKQSYRLATTHFEDAMQPGQPLNQRNELLDSADREFDRCVLLAEAEGDEDLLIRSVNRRAELQIADKRIEQAADIYEEAASNRSGLTKESTGRLWMSHSQLMVDLKLYDKGLSSAERSLDSTPSAEEEKLATVNAGRIRAEALEAIGNVDAALIAWNQCAQQAQASGQILLQHYATQRRLRLIDSTGQLQHTIKTLKLRRKERGISHAEVSQATMQLLQIAWYVGQREEAVKYLGEFCHKLLRSELERGGTPKETSDREWPSYLAFAELAAMHLASDSAARASGPLINARQIRRLVHRSGDNASSKDSFWQANVGQALAIARAESGRYRDAIDELEHSIETFEALKDPLSIASSLSLKGHLLIRARVYDEGVQCLSEAFEQATFGGVWDLAQTVLLDLHRAYQARSEGAAARFCLVRAASISRIDDPAGVYAAARQLKSFGLSKSVIDLLHGCDTWSNVTDEERCRLLTINGRAHRACKDPPAAIDQFKKALQLLPNTGLNESEFDLDRSRILNSLCAAHRENGDPVEAIRCGKEALKHARGDQQQIIQVLNTLALGYAAADRFVKAKEISDIVMEVSARKGGQQFAVACNTRGNMLATVGKHQNAIEVLEAGLRAATNSKRRQSKVSVVYILMRLAQIERDIGLRHSAYQRLEAVISEGLRAKDEGQPFPLDRLSIALEMRASLLIDDGAQEQALEDLKRCCEIARISGTRVLLEVALLSRVNLLKSLSKKGDQPAGNLLAEAKKCSAELEQLRAA